MIFRRISPEPAITAKKPENNKASELAHSAAEDAGYGGSMGMMMQSVGNGNRRRGTDDRAAPPGCWNTWSIALSDQEEGDRIVPHLTEINTPRCYVDLVQDPA